MKKLPIVALIGQTNAGKSSLLNRMAHFLKQYPGNAYSNQPKTL